MRDFPPDLLGLPCWGVKRGHGSFLTLEFGAPRLVIREPLQSTSPSARVRRGLARRHVYVAGDWHLWIYMCHWQVHSGGRVSGDSSSNRRVQNAVRVLDGQRLIGVSLSPKGARTRFAFDLGAVLETKPYDRKSEQWMLYCPNGRVLTLRADRRYSLTDGDKPESRRSWRAA